MNEQPIQYFRIDVIFGVGEKKFFGVRDEQSREPSEICSIVNDEGLEMKAGVTGIRSHPITEADLAQVDLSDEIEVDAPGLRMWRLKT